MLAVGYFAGMLLGWNHMDSLFLGGMLSMSSTTIIIKAFDDLKLRAQRFTEIVFGVLIIEDIAGIVMMVLLATIGRSQRQCFHNGAAAQHRTLDFLPRFLMVLFWGYVPCPQLL